MTLSTSTYTGNGENPAAVSRGVGAIFAEITGYQVKQTRAAVRVAQNAPDDFEREALGRFAADPALLEYWRQMEQEGRPVYRYAAPLRMDQECLACHGGTAGEVDMAGYRKEGYREGELGSAISVVLPMDESIARLRRNAITQVWAMAERSRELEQANQGRTRFLAMDSHELRTPLTSIIAFTELQLKQATGLQQEYLEDVLESSRNLLDMVNNLLDLSRLKAGRVQLFTEVVSLPELLPGVKRALRPLAEKQGLRLEIAAPDGLPLLLDDPLRVKQVLMNLLGNAVKFTPAGGQIRVSARPATAGWVQVEVADTGPGIAPEHRDVIFEAFRRVEGRGPYHPGSGLGLALARSLVELHGGRIWVEAAPGGGSLFCFVLPATRCRSSSSRPAATRPTRSSASGWGGRLSDQALPPLRAGAAGTGDPAAHRRGRQSGVGGAPAGRGAGHGPGHPPGEHGRGAAGADAAGVPPALAARGPSRARPASPSASGGCGRRSSAAPASRST